MSLHLAAAHCRVIEFHDNEARLSVPGEDIALYETLLKEEHVLVREAETYGRRRLAALGLIPGGAVTERQAELPLGEGRNPKPPDRGRAPGGCEEPGGRTAGDRPRAAVADITGPVLALDLVFRPQATIVVGEIPLRSPD